ncbi:hypothetical protein SBA4_790016 [Candidatus Sulfopaludibacter sp. SbA4]|nr:hypothetical protein SBA4_790016 [Candidatus Sulfopaludibacter sp. SbA4]
MPFKSVASERFWRLYAELPEEIQKLADKQYELFEPGRRGSGSIIVWWAIARVVFFGGAGSARMKPTTRSSNGLRGEVLFPS